MWSHSPCRLSPHSLCLFWTVNRNKHLFILQVESPIICPLLEEMDAYGLFQVVDSWILPASYLSVESISM